MKFNEIFPIVPLFRRQSAIIPVVVELQKLKHIFQGSMVCHQIGKGVKQLLAAGGKAIDRAHIGDHTADANEPQIRLGGHHKIYE